MKRDTSNNFLLPYVIRDRNLHVLFLFRCSFDATKSTKGASKLRRDLINAEIANLRDLLPLPSSTRQRLSQLQLMALVCVYVRKANYFQHGKLHAKTHYFSLVEINILIQEKLLAMWKLSKLLFLIYFIFNLFLKK